MEPVVNARMSISDWSGLVALVVSLCALISPLLTAIFNNRHQRKMKQMEYDHQEKEEQQKREREIYEGYIRAAGAAVQYQTKESIQAFGEHSALAMYYVPEELRADMLQLEKLARQSSGYDDFLGKKVDLLNKIIGRMRELQGTQWSLHQ